jgi:hypothetical protein
MAARGTADESMGGGHVGGGHHDVPDQPLTDDDIPF